MAAAITARRCGLEVVVLDDQPEPGGQIWRSVERTGRFDNILGPAYVEGRAVTDEFRASRVSYLPGVQLWHLESGFRALVSRDCQAQVIEASTVILATGAQERPVPFPGWTLPGVLTVGAAQILLKTSGQIPTGPLWIAGSGPLPLLYAVQFLRAGGQLAGYLDTTPVGQWKSALRYLPGAFRSAGEVLKGIGWMGTLRASKAPLIWGVTEIEALGEDRIQALQYRTCDAVVRTVEAKTLLIHEGIVPSIHAPLAFDCSMTWNIEQECFMPVVDAWGESSRSNLFIAGDGAGIAGARAAQLRGELAALRIAAKLNRITEAAAATAAGPIRRRLNRELALRPFIDALFKPRPQVFAPKDQTIVCRCEEVTASRIRAAAAVGRPGPNQIKAATRAGMGPCQGRQCGYTVTRILAAVQSRTPSEIGFFHIRPPLKPVTLSEYASLNKQDAYSATSPESKQGNTHGTYSTETSDGEP